MICLNQLQCHTCDIFAAGTVYGWGMGTSLQLAQTEEDDLFEPTEMTGKQLESRYVCNLPARLSTMTKVIVFT